jgi:hypothetical protein
MAGVFALGMSVAADSAATASSVTNTRVARLAFAACCLLIASCAANTGVVPNGSGSYIVAKQAATGFPGLGNLKADALEEANHYCSGLPGSGHELFVTHTTETQPPYVLGNYPRAEVEFRCDAPGTGADAAVLECGERHKRGELKSFKAEVECSNPKVYSAWKAAGDPNLDLLNVLLAAKLVGAEKVDKGQVTLAEYQLQLAELNTRITEERRRRNFANADLQLREAEVSAQTQAAQAQSTAALLQGLAALQSANRPIK